tara:strand:+ start:181 stop:450 length:270 start_codon:yes stop_codon:yes gene_type:complete
MQNAFKQNKVRRQQTFKQGRCVQAYKRCVLCAKGYRQTRADLLRVTLVMQTMFGGLTCLWSQPWDASSARKISGALEPTRNFGESVGRG